MSRTGVSETMRRIRKIVRTALATWTPTEGQDVRKQEHAPRSVNDLMWTPTEGQDVRKQYFMPAEVFDHGDWWWPYVGLDRVARTMRAVAVAIAALIAEWWAERALARTRVPMPGSGRESKEGNDAA